jgi:hypothetical protein
MEHVPICLRTLWVFILVLACTPPASHGMIFFRTESSQPLRPPTNNSMVYERRGTGRTELFTHGCSVTQLDEHAAARPSSCFDLLSTRLQLQGYRDQTERRWDRDATVERLDAHLAALLSLACISEQKW